MRTNLMPAALDSRESFTATRQQEGVNKMCLISVIITHHVVFIS